MDWQTLVSLLCVAAAAMAVGMRLRGWMVGSAKSSCGSCHGCSANPQSLVQIKISNHLTKN